MTRGNPPWNDSTRNGTTIKNIKIMEFIGTLKQLVSERSGDGQNGPWRINSYLLETVEMYPKRMVVEVRDNIQLWDSLIGKTVIVKFNIDAREWQGKWFNSLRAYALAENTEEEQKRRTARRMPKPTGEIVSSQPDQEQTEKKKVDWNAMGQQQGQQGEGEKDDDDLPF